MFSVSDWFEASCSRAASVADCAAASAALRRGELRRDVVELFLADRAGARPAARAARRRPGRAATSLCARADVGLAGGDLRLQRAVVDVHRAHLAHRLRELRLGLLERDLRVGRIELDQRLAGLDEVGVVGVDRDDGARDLRRHLDDVALHVGVVGALVVVEVERVVDAVGGAGEEHGERRRERARSCAARRRLRRARRRPAGAAGAVGGGRGRRSGGRGGGRLATAMRSSSARLMEISGNSSCGCRSRRRSTRRQRVPALARARASAGAT